MKRTENTESLRDMIFGSDDIKREPVTIPEWGVTVQVTALTGEERAKIIDASTDKNGKTDGTKLYYAAIMACTRDGNGARVFEEGDEERLRGKNGAVLERLAEASFRLCGIGMAANEALEKN